MLSLKLTWHLKIDGWNSSLLLGPGLFSEAMFLISWSKSDWLDERLAILRETSSCSFCSTILPIETFEVGHHSNLFLGGLT